MSVVPLEQRGALLARFATDARDQRALALVRAVSALLASLGAVAMLLAKLPFVAFLLALLALGISLVWLRVARRAAARARRREPEVLAVHALGFALDEGEHTQWVPWSNVERVAVDEDRLDIVVQRRAGERLRIEPRYPGVDLYELVRTLDDARDAAHRQSAAPSDSTPARDRLR